MTARRASSNGPEAGSFGGRVLLIGAVIFAATATGLLVLTEEQKWLRLGIVAALWAALTGAFLAARYRRQLTDQREAAAERQEIYELELEREIAARREYELEVAAEAKRQAEQTSRDDIAALRGELQNMRQTLESLLGGEFLVERYALRAESTRMRSLPEERSLSVHRDIKHLPAAQARPADAQVVREAETDLIERIREVHQKPPRRDQSPARPEPRVADSRPPSVPRGPERPRTDWPTPEPVKPATRSEPVQPAALQDPIQPPTTALPRQDPIQPATTALPRQDPIQPPNTAFPRPEPAAARQERPQFVDHPAEVSDRWFMPDGLAEQGPPAPRRSEQPRRQEQQRPADPAPRRTAATTSWADGGQEWAPSWETRREPETLAEGLPRPEPAQAFDTGAPPNVGSEPTGSWLAQYNQPPNAEPTFGARAYVPQSRPEPQPEPTAGHRHRAEPTEESGGGRRRRAEGQPSWQETVGRRAEESGSHASGRSVSELLANNGHDSSPRRRRRRED
jgi:hypothetical protein